MARNFTIAVEGNIAAGKSTLLEKLQLGNVAQVVVEPVAEWQSVFEGADGNIMERMYQDPKRWAYLFQNYVLLTMMEAHNTPQVRPMKVMERSVYSARYCFVENLRKSDPPLVDDMEHKVYSRWFDFLMANSAPQLDLIVYLRTSPEVCYERLRQRGRKEESPVQLSYLRTLHERYEDWLFHKKILDGDGDCNTNESLHDGFCTAINESLANLPAKVKEPLTGSPFSKRKYHTAPACVDDNDALQPPVRRLFVDDDS